MPTNISRIKLKASVDSVWEALTDPQKVKLWQFGSDLVTTWEIGSEIKFITEWKGAIFKQWGKVLEFRSNELIRYSLFAPRPDLEDTPENYFIMNYVLTPEEEHTNLEIIREDNRPNAIQEAPQGEENPILQSLKTIVESVAR
jgi:uncharacterized protein YndB with AHSA1/START domain